MHPLFKTTIVSALTSLLLACGGGAVTGEAPVTTEDTTTVLQDEPPELASAQVPAETVTITNAATDEPAPTANANQAPAPLTEPVPEPAPERETTVNTGQASAAQIGEQESSSNSVPEVSNENRQYSAADITDLILVTGQSNALGSLSAFDPVLDAPHERAFAFTDQGWQQADLHQVWDLGQFPRGNPGEEPNNNLSLHMAKEITRQRGDRVVGFILATAPGQGIDHWNTDDGFFWQIDEKVLQAINQTPHKSQLDGILWPQGENDEGDQNYHVKLDSLIANFRQQSWFSSDRPFICGETAVFEVVNRQLSALNNNGDRWSGCVGSENLQTHLDGFHFNAEGLRELGKRYAIKYLQLLSN